MCGIFGFCKIGDQMDKDLNAEFLRKATRLLSHRGPDAEGFAGWTFTNELLRDGQLQDQTLKVGMGHRRLAILDLTDAGRQPMCDANGNWIVFNGEIYNFQEVRSELISLGARFYTRTDTEVILNAYSVWGEDCVTHFNGMWAFVILDIHNHCLFASRDRLGVKPFYYILNDHFFIFSSEVKPFFCHPLQKPLIDKERLIYYLVDHTIDDGPKTIYRNIRELRGGHQMRIDFVKGDQGIRPYWTLPEEPDLELGESATLDRYSELIEDAVRLRLYADVPVAITLSGGVDSSVIALAASRVHNAPVKTFTSRFPENLDIDESSYARQVADACNLKAHFIEPNAQKMMAEEPALTRHQEMPYGSLSIYIHWMILAEIRANGYPVVLSGQGGDETFLGYERYYVSAIAANYPNISKQLLLFCQTILNSRLTWRELAAYIMYFSFPSLQRRARLLRTQKIYHHDLIDHLPDPVNEVFRNIRHLQASELLNRTLSTLLRYDDRTSGALGMETRLPFLDYRMVEFAYKLPLKYKIRNGWTKYLSRSYLARHLPKTITWRKNKLGFNAPQAQWTEDLVRERGGHLQAIPFAEGLLSRDTILNNLPMRQKWDVYNTLQLADLLNWDWAQ